MRARVLGATAVAVGVVGLGGPVAAAPAHHAVPTAVSAGPSTALPGGRVTGPVTVSEPLVAHADRGTTTDGDRRETYGAISGVLIAVVLWLVVRTLVERRRRR